MIFEDMYKTHKYYKNNIKQLPQKRGNRICTQLCHAKADNIQLL